jgi:hypothetical protein
MWCASAGGRPQATQGCVAIPVGLDICVSDDAHLLGVCGLGRGGDRAHVKRVVIDRILSRMRSPAQAPRPRLFCVTPSTPTTSPEGSRPSEASAPLSSSAKPGLAAQIHNQAAPENPGTEHLALLLRRLSPAAGMFGKDYCAGAPLGLGRPNSTDCSPFSTTIERKPIPCTRQPSFSCPTRSREIASVLEP